jgi:hypothetical protein
VLVHTGKFLLYKALPNKYTMVYSNIVLKTTIIIPNNTPILYNINIMIIIATIKPIIQTIQNNK